MAIWALSVFTLALMLGAVSAERKQWVLTIAGSAGYGNYRHQADVCHAYHIASANGIPDENIVVMMYDDIANNTLNPVQGNIINRPDGPNVYPGVPKDYTGKDVNADVFLAVLQGDVDKVKQLTGKDDPKVIASGPDDYVFVNFADHGGPGILGMPQEPYLAASDVNKALQNMYDNQKFAKLVFYVEACESGSIFEGLLPETINVYVTTAANAKESSMGCYCENDRHTCLGDTYSVNWMENCDAVDIKTETLEQQYNIVREETNQSHVMQYGDKSFTSLKVSEFLGDKKSNRLQRVAPQTPYTGANTFVPTDEVGIFTLQKLLKAPEMENREEEISAELEEQLWLRSQTDALFSSVAEAALPNEVADWVVNTRPQIQQRSAYEYAVGHLMALCPRLRPSVNDFVLRRLNAMVNLSNSLSLGQVLAAVELAAQKSPLC